VTPPQPPPTGPRSAIVRPGHDGRPHPDPRADPPTEVLDPSATPTVRLPSVVADTVRIPSVVRGVEPGEDNPDAGLSDGLALSLSSVLGSLAGFLSWLIAARIMPTAAMGDATLVVSAFILVGGAAQLNLGVALMRWIPSTGRSTGRLIWNSLLLTMPLSGLVGLVYALFAPRLATISAGPDGPFAFGLLLFVLACAGWGAFVIHDYILVALHKPWWAVWRNGIFALVRLGLLALLGGAVGLGSYGIVLSWVGPIVVWIVVGSIVILVLARRSSARAKGGALPGRTEVVAFLAPTAVGQIGGALLYNQVPVLINLRFGPEIGAVFFIAWQAIAVIDLAGMFFMNSLSVTVAREPHRARELANAARRRLLIMFLPMLALGAALAYPLLLIFGEAYAEGATVLRLLLLGLAFRLIVAHELGVRQATGSAMAYARLQLSSSVLVVVAALVTPVTGAGVSALVPVAIGYVAVQVVCAAAVLLSPARRRAQVEVSA
jgi:O-antigen/teichoic acid export membrane protein